MIVIAAAASGHGWRGFALLRMWSIHGVGAIFFQPRERPAENRDVMARQARGVQFIVFTALNLSHANHDEIPVFAAAVPDGERVDIFTCQSARCCYNPRSFALCNN
ncbi:hypothetical protein [Chromobacterium sp. IIBBL 290-4]|uniref:hypothetical protein n=1 Tax=Chromobacterium sp. IIBBL 290-4 TaxID=2953890 RepID=UPI0020B63987|nr:hypothetical protein [Chromobacterium sp. IIBBL 290-4]UTH73835.1 hypothetical protein NKT35_20180 [Chromobacterium sp. IIBBL 290-4]